ncbi:MAG: Coenzyme biosynthesis-associated protein [Acidimicrobiaceae bacterium]|nr:Coenzyme biosynthesis-associated protein [Acidimicrobiaceae bacterium]
MAHEHSGAGADLVAWDVAERVARQLLWRAQPLERSVKDRIETELGELTSLAESLVSDATGLVSSEGPARALVTDRAGWVHANVRSFERLLRPLVERLANGSPRARRALSPTSKAVSAVEVGTVLAWMSGRVLGQYDLLPVEGADDGDVVYYVGPNIVELERRYGFAPSEFRLWIALHEVTHRMQFTGVPWLRDHFLGLVERGTAFAAPDGRVVLDSLLRAVSEVRAGHNPLAEGGVVGLLASSEQIEILREAQALMSLLEGHGDVVMGLAGADRIPGAQRFAETLRQRRESAGGVARTLQQLIGIEAKMRQYAQGEHFVEHVRDFGGDALFSEVWSGPEMLPTLDEIRAPDMWIARVGGVAAARA